MLALKNAVLLILLFFIIADTFGESTVNITSKDNLIEQGLDLNYTTIVAVHPFNWIERHSDVFWNQLAKPLHLQFLDRSTGFMEGEDWYQPYINTMTLHEAHKNNIYTGSYLILTPKPPQVYGVWKTPEGDEEDIFEVGAGRNLNDEIIWRDDMHATFSVSCPYWLDHFAGSAEKILDAGMDAINIDNIAATPFCFGGDFSAWSVYKFKEYLRARYNDSLGGLGIPNLDEFRIRDYLRPEIPFGEAEIIVIASPTLKFSSEEINEVENFVSNGGSLFIHAEPGDQAYVLNDLLEKYGITLTTSAILSSKHLWDVGSFETNRIYEHPITNNLDSLVLNWASSIQIDNKDVVTLIESDENSWLDIDRDRHQDDDEPLGPFPVLIALEYGNGRIIVFSDRMQDSMFERHQELAKNALEWLVNGDQKTLLFDESKGEEASISLERAEKMSPSHPEWLYYGEFKKLAESLGYIVKKTSETPSFPGDRVLKEFVKFQHLELINFIHNFTMRVRKYGDEKLGRHVPIYGNQWMGLGSWGLGSVFLSPYLDVVQVESDPTFPPRYKLTFKYSMAHAMAEYSKPVWQLGAFYGEDLEEGLNFNKGNLVALDIAAAYANGAIKELDLGGFPGYPPVGGVVITPEMKTLEVVREVVDFIWEHRDLLTGFKPQSNVGIVFSIPSFLWNLYPAQDLYPVENMEEIVGISDILQNLLLPYDIVIFGHPELLDDTYHMKKLANYDALIMPRVDHIATYQLEALKTYVEAGGKLIITSEIPRYDEEHEELSSENQAILNGLSETHPDRVIFIEEPVGRRWHENLETEYADYGRYSDALNLIDDALSTLNVEPIIKVDGARGLVEVSALRKGEAFVIHLINYNYDLGSDSLEQQNELSVSLVSSLLDERFDISYFSPETGEIEVPTSFVDGYLKIEIPKLNYWGFLVLNRPRIRIDLDLNTARINVGSNAPISWNAYYEIDNQPFEGSVILNDTLRKDSVGQYTFTVDSCYDSKRMPIAFTSNSISCVWDRINIIAGGVSRDSTIIGETEIIWLNAEYEYDSEVFDGSKGTLYVNDEPMEWSSKNNRWEKRFVFYEPEEKSFKVTGIVDDKYGLTLFNDQVSPLIIKWKSTVKEEPEPFLPIWIVFAIVVGAGAALLVYFKKVKPS